jgi:sterol desaturase/sphingolipid hydroxylase (fatty acid hydroxylase superfamily)
VTEDQFQLLRAAGFVLAATLALGLERLSPHGRLRPSWRVNTGLWAINLVVMGSVCGACACTAARWAAGQGVGLFNALGTSPWVAAPLTIAGLDLVSYAWHRANHGVALLWRFHQVHHTDPTFTASTALRFHPGELLLSLPLRLAAVVALGAPAAAVVAFEIAFAVANLVEHGDIDLPTSLEARVGRVLIVPALHRLHHSRSRPERDSNFGTVFSVWDRALGTFRASTSARQVPTGLAEAPTPRTASAALALPLGRRGS